MFGRRSGFGEELLERPATDTAVATLQRPSRVAAELLAGRRHNTAVTENLPEGRKTDEYYDLKRQVFGALIEIIDVSQLTQMDVDQARVEIRDVVSEIVAAKKVVTSTAEQEELLEDICNDVLGYGPLQPLLARDDIADIMVNGSNRIFIEVGGKVSETDIRSQSAELAEELSLTTAELSYLPERRKAYENLGERTGLDGVKAVVTSLVQAEKYGTPIGQALRVLAQENRDMRMSEAEKKAAALPPKLTVPMIVFFLPVLFAVIATPAGIQIANIQ